MSRWIIQTVLIVRAATAEPVAHGARLRAGGGGDLPVALVRSGGGRPNPRAVR